MTLSLPIFALAAGGAIGGTAPATGAIRNVAIGSALPNAVVTAGSGNAKTRVIGERTYVIGADCDRIYVPWANTQISNGNPVGTGPFEVAGPGDLTVAKVAAIYNGVSSPITYSAARGVTVAASATSQVNSDAMIASAWGVSKFTRGSTIKIRWGADMTTAGGVASTPFGTETLYRFPPVGTTDFDPVDQTTAIPPPASNDPVNIPGPVGVFGKVYGTPVSLVMSGDSISDNANDFPGAGGDGTAITSLTGGGGWISRMASLAQIPLLKMSLGGHKAAYYGNTGGGATYAWRNMWWQFGTHGLNELGVNDTVSTANIESYNRTIWGFMFTAGIQRIMQATITPKTLNDSAQTPWNVNTTLAGESQINPPDFLTINAQFRADVGGGFHLNEVIDIETIMGDASNRRLWPVPSPQLSTTLAAALTASSQSSISLAAPAAMGALLALGSQATGVQVVKTSGPSTGTGPYATPIVTQTLATAFASGTTVIETYSADGTHPGPRAHAFIANAVKAQAQGWTATA